MYEEVRPPQETLLSAHRAVEVYSDWLLLEKRLPQAGGTDDMDAEWVDQIRCCQQADSELDGLDQRESQAKASQKEIIVAR